MGANNESPEELKDNLSDDYEGRDPARQIRGELGVFHLARGEYAPSLAAFLEGGFWMDAAYVAERVMTVDELKAFVDSYQVSPVASDAADDERSPTTLAGRLRYLLARRLTRTIRGDQARPYYPAEQQPDFDRLAQELLVGWDESLRPEQRAKALFTAARLTRAQGMELLGTEVGPDWHICGGSCTENLSAKMRKNFTLMPATPDEISRAARHNADPEARFHYRYQAAFLAWEAAKLMGNDSDQTATVLCTAGSWLKARDPQTADLFYKALVRRCGRTSIGSQADRLRWFPQVDDVDVTSIDPVLDPVNFQTDETNGTMEEALSAEFPVPGRAYVVHEGDTLADIAAAASVWGETVTPGQILEANEDLEADKLQAGQKIMIPGSQ